jgi:polyhydroxybutyrate depolymerase
LGDDDAMAARWESIEVGGARRDFRLAEPAGPPAAVILSLHGTRSSAGDQVRFSRLAAEGPPAGAVVAFPQGVVPAGRGYQWNAEVDLPYLSAVIERLAGRYPGAAQRVALTGMSGGARMACHLASVRPDLVSLVGAVAGVRAPTVARPSRPVPVLAFHGTADRINPYAGKGDARWNESVPDAVRGWAVANGLDPHPTVTEVSPHVSEARYGGPGEPGEVALWTVRGGGHTWPGTRLGPLVRLILGSTTTEIDATALILAAVAGR